MSNIGAPEGLLWLSVQLLVSAQVMTWGPGIEPHIGLPA